MKDVFHSPLFRLPAVLPCAAVVTVHDAIPVVRPELSNPEFTRLFEENAREACERAAAVVCPSEHAKKDVVSALGVAAEKVHVIVETPAPHFRVLEGQKPGGYFLVVGSLEERKNPRVVLEALANLPKEDRKPVVFVGPNAGFDVIGLASELGVLENVVRHGAVSDTELVQLYNDAIALIVPSRYEGFGLPVVEAFACGTPVISSTAASLPEVAGDAAFFFSPDDAAGLAELMRSLTEDKRAELRTRGFEQLKRFTRERVCGQLAELYSALEP